MNKILMSLLVAGLASTSVVHAAGYGVVDLEKVVENSTYLKQQNASLQQTVNPQTTKLEQLGKELEGIQQRAQQNPNLSEAEKQKMMTQYQTKLKEFNSIQQGVQTTVQSAIQVMNKTLDGRVKQVAEQLRKENNLDVVLNKNSALAYDAKYDLTDKMIQKVNVIK
ncbi:OmpH family outer membrane protein [Acinetobacter bohemicus]|uniref:Outer membrane protein n=1 Tax=Acinetobacter bohemicus TaxID=1435036 RepID=A0A1I6RFN1_9GAMM|nr:OmpH family outer membrane protein [Acinetobacter bohemicus]KAB0653551.1 OmpH family outer membrane protein [Acinetobacter bohemicus]SFS63278.1 outer membrane protein [Acinetobacter bohemicus]